MSHHGPFVVWLDEAGPESSALLGGKFSSLAELVQAGFGVPPGFAVTTNAYWAFMSQDGLLARTREIREQLDCDDLAAVESASAEVTRMIETTPMPPALVGQIVEAYEALSARVGTVDTPVAVRSSGVAEDTAGASFAGQYETYLWLIGADAVIEHIRRCWCGLFGPQVLTYRPDGGVLSEEAVAMAVGVQQMVLPRAAGVMFTLDPVTGDRSKIVIEGSWGLGEAVVAGEVTPDRFRVDKVTLELLERKLASKEQEYRFEPETGVRLRDVPSERHDEPCLEDEQITALATLAKTIERHRKAPQDIEWAVDERGRAHVLQVRPETVWSRREVKPIAPGGSALGLVIGKFMTGVSSPDSGEGRVG